MFNLGRFKTYSRAVALGAVAISAIAFAGPGKAAPVQLFPFFQPALAAPQPIQPYQPYQTTPYQPYQTTPYQAAPSGDQNAIETPARFRRQTVSYAKREAP